MKISWRDKKSNEVVLKLADERLYIVPLLEGPLEGKLSRGRPRTEWLTNITEWTGMLYQDLVRIAQDREQWRIMTAHLLKEDGT